MDLTKELLIEKLLKQGKISKDDAIILKREKTVVEYITPPPPVNPYIDPVNPYIDKDFTNPYRPKDYITEELYRRARIAENCGCNPANGGSGICGCVLTGPIIT